MAKITLNNIGTGTAFQTAITPINANNDVIETAFENTLSRDGTSPNTMEAHFDMNSNRILNLPSPVTTTEPLRLEDLNTFIGGGTVSSIPAGGSIRSALVKNSATDYDITWSSTTGTGSVVYSTSPTLVTPSISGNITVTKSSGVLSESFTATDSQTQVSYNGHGGVSYYIQDTNAGSNLKYFQFNSVAGTTSLRSLTDLGALQQTFLNLNHSSGQVSIPTTTASTSTSTGALVVTGGVGIGGNVYSGGVFSSILKGNRLGVHGGTAVTGALAQSDANIVLYNVSSENWSGIGNDNNGTFWIRTGLSGTPAAALYIDTSRNVFIPVTTASSSTATGALVVGGGVGVAGNMWVGGNLRLPNNVATSFLDNFTEYQIVLNTQATAADSYGIGIRAGKFVCNTGSGGGYDWDITGASTAMTLSNGGVLSIFATTASTSTTTGALVVSGGVGIAGRLNIGGAAVVSPGATGNPAKSGTTQAGLGFRLATNPGASLNNVLDCGGYNNHATFAYGMWLQTGNQTALGNDSSIGLVLNPVGNDTFIGGPLKLLGNFGWITGAGGTVTQATSKSTAVTLNRPTGAITTHNAALAAATIVSFTLTNSTIAATDMIVATHESGGTLGAYTINARATGAGTASIDIRNNTAGSLSEALELRFAVIKSVDS